MVIITEDVPKNPNPYIPTWTPHNEGIKFCITLPPMSPSVRVLDTVGNKSFFLSYTRRQRRDYHISCPTFSWQRT